MQKWHIVAVALAGYDAITNIFPVDILCKALGGDQQEIR
jgi:hypothetical protein